MSFKNVILEAEGTGSPPYLLRVLLFHANAQDFILSEVACYIEMQEQQVGDKQ